MSLSEKTLPPDFVIDEKLAQTIRAYLYGGLLPCAAAFAVAETHHVAPLKVGQTADALAIHINRCQLGLFGQSTAEKAHLLRSMSRRPISREAEQFIIEHYQSKGGFTCMEAWLLADHYAVSRAQIGTLADKLKLRIYSCQLGAF